MTPYDQNERPDNELEAALEVLKSVPQSTVAFEIGISERRLRDIEWGRSKPRARTRAAILRLADDVHAENGRNPESGPWKSGGAVKGPRPYDASNAADPLSEGQVSPVWAIVIGALLVVGMCAIAWFGQRPGDD